METINIDSFPLSFGKLYLSENLVLYRGYHKNYPVVSERPTFFSTKKETAYGYVKSSGCELGVFTTTKPVTLYDIRFIGSILQHLFKGKKINTKAVIECCKTLTLAFGLCSYDKQIQLYRERYGEDVYYNNLVQFQKQIQGQIIKGINPVEPSGFRIAETNNDTLAVCYLKEIFGGKIDGFIAPAMYSPSGNMHTAEILLFNPLGAGIKAIPEPSILKEIPTNSMLSIMTEVQFQVSGFEPSTYVMGGGTSSIRQEPDQKYMEKCMRKAAKIRSWVQSLEVYAPLSNVTIINPWVV